MKTSFPEIVETEKYLQQELDPQDNLLFEARLLVSDQWRRNTFFHKMVHRLVHLYHRKKLKAEVDAVHNKLFRDPAKGSFRNQFTNLFNR
jgi:hypothetical protein